MRFWTATATLLLLLAGVDPSAAQATPDETGKIAEVRETNAAGDEIQSQKEDLSPAPAYFAVIGLGDHSNAFGQSAAAEAFVDDGGTFWGRVNADNNNLPFNDWGNGEANTTLAYLLHKKSGEPAKVTLQFTGGELSLADFGGGTRPLEAGVLLEVQITPVGLAGPASEQYFATLSGRGGSAATETFDWSQAGFDITDANYTEDGFGDSITSADLVIPPKTVPYVLDFLCDECDILFWVELHVFAKNPGGETIASAYFRDPAHVDDAAPDLGGAAVSYEGLTLVPAPEPAAPACAAAALVALALSARRSPRRASRPRRTTPRATAPAA
jgi:hypothetical protein